MKFTAVVCSHDDERGLRAMLGVLRYQTQAPDETLVFYSGDRYDDARLLEEFPEMTLLARRANLEDWGHAKRAEGVQRAHGEWVGFFNSDDSYTRDYVERMLAATTDTDVVYCGWKGRDGNPDCTFHTGSSTAGNFIVRTELARELGWNGRHYGADGEFITRLNEADARIAKVPHVLYTHR